jgi:ketosteroid isomerase-like protein
MRESRIRNSMTALVIVALGLPGVVIAGDGPDTAELAAELKATEEAFARTMANRDHDAFVSFLDDETIFEGPAGELRGKDAVAAAWKPLYQGPQPPFSWQPESVSVLDSGTLGLSSGPIFAPDGRRVGTFNSVWRRRPDGTWKVIFDRGCPQCECPP